MLHINTGMKIIKIGQVFVNCSLCECSILCKRELRWLLDLNSCKFCDWDFSYVEQLCLSFIQSSSITPVLVTSFSKGQGCHLICQACWWMSERIWNIMYRIIRWINVSWVIWNNSLNSSHTSSATSVALSTL